MRNRIELFLEDFTYNTSFRLLEEGKDKTELDEIAEKRGIRLPSHDLSIFKGRYAYVDRMNLNKCTLPKDEVEVALDTLNGKAIDFDHYRKNVVGHWIDAKIEGDEIIAYGIFYKGNFQEDYSTIQELMEKDVLAISMEAWGNRDINDDGSYSLKDIEFAGGALLIKTKPAAPGSEVLEMSNKGRVLELAEVLTPPSNFIHFKNDKNINESIIFASTNEKVNDKKNHFPINNKEEAKAALTRVAEYSTAPIWYNGALSEVVDKVKIEVQNKYPSIEVVEDLPEQSRYFVWDIESIAKSIYEVDCVSCGEKGFSEVDLIDFKNNKAKITCLNCETEMALELTPMAKLSKKGRKIKKVAAINHDSAQAKAGDNTDNVENNTTKEEEQSMKKLLEKFKVDTVEKLVQSLAKAKIDRELSKDELSFAYTVIEYKAGGGDVNSTSLLSLKGTSTASPVSLVAASIEEKDINFIITEIDKITQAEKVNLIDEEPVVEEPVVEEPVVEAPVVEEPVVEKPVVEAPVVEEPVVEAPVKDASEEIDAKNTEIAKLKVKVAAYEKAEKEAEEKVKADLIEARRNELGEFGKDLSKEDLLNEDKFTIAKQNKVIAELKAGTVEEPVVELDLSKGSIDKSATDEETKSRHRVKDLAWASDEE